MVSLRSAALAFAAISIVNGSPCPFGQMVERGEVSADDAAKFYAVRSEGSAAVENMMSDAAAVKQKREFDAQQDYYDHQMRRGLLSLGGGLLGGVLQPFTGVLAALDVPVPQKTGLVKIPDEEHPYARPAADEVRGMCPTLNTMANHGYISRTGITTFAEAANACQITLGFGYDTCVFLSALGLLSGGDLVSGKYSIGGQDDRVPNSLGPALGISTHGPFEIDDSISRIDTTIGNQASFNLTRFNRIVDMANKNHNGLFGLDLWAEERKVTFQESMDTNPNFDSGPKALAVALAERVFIPRALPNGTNQDVADYANVAPFFMNETFPKNWFRRATPYSLVNVGTDIVALFAMSPTLPGHNEGVGNFIPLGSDLSDLTDGTGLCFIEQTILSLSDGQVSPVIAEAWDVVMGFLQGAIKPFFAHANCDFGPTRPSAGYAKPGVNSETPYLHNGVYSPADSD